MALRGGAEVLNEESVMLKLMQKGKAIESIASWAEPYI